MSKIYPCIGSKKKPKPNAHPNAGGDCICCKTKTTGGVEIQVSWFRGDDEFRRLCKDCQRLPSAQIIAAYTGTNP